MFKIAMMTAWNTDSGVAIHAEPVGKAWIEMGHDLRIFTFLKDDYHGEHIERIDVGPGNFDEVNTARLGCVLIV